MRHFEDDRYFIEGSTGNEYLVELGSYEGNGWCDCIQFTCVHQPHLERGDRTIRRCKHILAVKSNLDEHSSTKGGSK